MNGTTLEILAPYLAYDIEVEFVNWNEQKVRATVEACSTKRFLPQGYAQGWVEYKDALPILRPFADLVKPLPDGSVPAVEVAKLLFAPHDEWRNDGPIDWNKVTVEPGFGDEIDIWLNGRAENLFVFWPEWRMQNPCSSAMDWNLALNYLHCNHFAVGLTPEQYVYK